MKIFWAHDNLNLLWKIPNASSMVYFNKQYLRSCDVPGSPHNFLHFFYLDYCLYYAIVLRPWAVLFETVACDHGTA